jgi:hypothetical protein
MAFLQLFGFSRLFSYEGIQSLGFLLLAVDVEQCDSDEQQVECQYNCQIVILALRLVDL